jgi:membrane-associated protein
MNTTDLVRTVGYLGIFAILFAETGLLIGFFLPGDTLLISAGLLASRGQLSLPLLIIGGSIAAVVGDALGYGIGREAGARLFQRDESFWFRRSHLERAQRFYEQHGGKTIFLARFIVVVRTFAPVVAGAARMPYRRFAVFNVAGAITWVCGISVLAYAFGSVVSTLDRYIIIGTLVILPLPLLLAVVQYVRLRRAHGRFKAAQLPVVQQTAPYSAQSSQAQAASVDDDKGSMAHKVPSTGSGGTGAERPDGP